MSLLYTPEGEAKRKKYGWPDLSNTMTIGVEMIEGQPCVSYTRSPTNKLILRLMQPTPEAVVHEYQPLPSGCIRLLRRVPQPDGNIVVFDFITLLLTNTNNNPDFSAISYCWGAVSTQSSLVLTDGSYIPIGSKVAGILARIVGDRELIWLDAVCINQADPLEKANQIPLMSSIYQCASSVEIWLDLGDGISKVIDPWLQNSLTFTGTKFHVDHNSERGDPFSPYQTDKVVDVMWSSWFERAWVLQEFCFGTKFRFHYRDMELHLLFLNQVLDWGSNLKFSRFMDEDTGQCHIPLPPMIRYFRKFLTLRSFVSQGKQRRAGLEDILCQFYGLKATDPRDKVFAILNLVQEEYLKDLRPDYKRPVADIYLDTMRSVLSRGTSFRILGFAGLAAPRPAFEGCSHIPSWAPDLSTAPNHVVWSDQINRFKATAFPDDYRVVLLNAHINRFGLDNDPPSVYTLITPHGRHIDTVAGILRGNELSNFSQMPHFIREAMRHVQSLIPYSTSESARDVLRISLIAANHDCLHSDSEGAGFDQLYSLTQKEHVEFSLSAAWTVEGNYFQTMLTEGTGSTRGLLWTTNGHIGLAANGVEAGDEVWLLVGAKVPYIMRRSTNLFRTGHKSSDLSSVDCSENEDTVVHCHSLVCEAYIHGIMNNEVDILAGDTSILFLI